MGGDFNMNVAVRAGTIGVLNAEHSPVLAAILMAYHKLGYFFIMVTYFARILHYDREKYDNFAAFNEPQPAYLQIKPVTYTFWCFMILKSLVLMWTFHLSFWLYKDYLTCFIMTMITSIITLLLGAFILAHGVHYQLVVVYNYFLQLYQRGKKKEVLIN